jgi:hypothetical protein
LLFVIASIYLKQRVRILWSFYHDVLKNRKTCLDVEPTALLYVWAGKAQSGPPDKKARSHLVIGVMKDNHFACQNPTFFHQLLSLSFPVFFLICTMEQHPQISRRDDGKKTKKKSKKEENKVHRRSRRHEDGEEDIVVPGGALSELDNDILSDDETKRLKKELRRAEKRVARLRELGLDENGDPLDNFMLSKYPVREWTFTLLGSTENVAINPVVFTIAIVCLWSLALWSSGTCVRQNALV